MAPVQLSPFAPAEYPQMPAIAGVRLATAEAGIKFQGRTDMALAVFEPPAHVAGVFTRSRCAAAPVDWCRSILAAGKAAALVVNSGNANAFTGMKGRAATRASADAAARAVGCRAEAVFLASTGVIGEPLDPAPFAAHLAGMARRATHDGFADAARAIMTTDTYPKMATRTARIGGKSVTINGIAKGSGMIAPDMATMLAFIFTDAAIAPQVLQKALAKAMRGSFNAITVDGDTSTSDTVLLFATGAAASRGVPQIATPGGRALTGFQAALNDLCRELAQQIVKDGEGASKFAEINVTGAISAASAKKIALSVANSPLVKTA
ncbi:MAG TPA: bifunctional glutamate N-acetyltransferase/amino-acid acetyltransferase ArgJ, partial [Afifellaceae bacterium]|nr:bifunctional glutamate N-acetyltransferase/amino-acid acetyltransferase ArgJ [Afifellaceae bacterium]